MLNKKLINEKLINSKKINIILFDSIDSTNTYLKKLAKDKASEGTVVIANSQADGRGRMGRSFFSPQNTGIYMSILLKPTLSPNLSVLITSAAAVAIRDAILKVFDLDTQIKWVNDVFLNNKKICGILTEGAISSDGNSFDWAVLGIGINVFKPENGFSKEIQSIAGYIKESGDAKIKSLLCAEIINSFFKYYENLENREFLKAYRESSLVLGKEIMLLKNGDIIPAKALAIDNDCRLKVEYKNGKTEFISFGEISIKL